MDCGWVAAEFLPEFAHTGIPFFKVGRGALSLSSSREDKIVDVDVADGSTVSGGEGLDFAADAQRGFPGFVGWAGVSDDGRQDFAIVDNGSKIAEGWLERGILGAEEEAREDDVRVGSRDEEAPSLEFTQTKGKQFLLTSELLAVFFVGVEQAFPDFG